MDRAQACIVGALTALALALGGCGEYPLKESQIEAALPEKTAPIVVGETDRTGVRRLLGVPWLSSEYWRFDLYRVTDGNATLFWYLLPVGFSSQDVNGYVLVAYDARGTVTAYRHGFEREPSGVNWDPGVAASLVAGDVRFIAGEDAAFLAVTADRRDSYLSEYPVSQRCRVVVGCAPSQWCSARVKIDRDRQVELPVALRTLPHAVAIEELAAGEHGIEATPALFRGSFAGATRFMCPAGETRFIALELSPDDTKGVTVWRRNLFANFVVSNEVPETLRTLPLIIWGNGQWLVEQEPGR